MRLRIDPIDRRAVLLKRINKSGAMLKIKRIGYAGIFNFSIMAEGTNLESDYLDPNPGVATSEPCNAGQSELQASVFPSVECELELGLGLLQRLK